MPRHLFDLNNLVIFLLIGSGFVLAMYMMVSMLAPSAKSKEKTEPYECGEIIVGQPWVHVHIRYFIFAMLFLIFDIETVFLFPWALIFKKLALFGLIEMLVFIAILFVGLVYPWKKGVLKWEYSMRK